MRLPSIGKHPVSRPLRGSEADNSWTRAARAAVSATMQPALAPVLARARAEGAARLRMDRPPRSTAAFCARLNPAASERCQLPSGGIPPDGKTRGKRLRKSFPTKTFFLGNSA